MSMSRGKDDLSSPTARIPTSVRHLSEWQLWQQPRRVVAFCLASEVLVLVATVVALSVADVTAADLGLFGLLIGLGVFQAELGRRVERMRRRVSGVAHINMTSVWIFAGVLLLPIGLTAVLTMTLYLHLSLRSWFRLHRTPAWRSASNAAILVLTCFSSYSVLAVGHVDGMPAAIDAGWYGVAIVVLTLAVHFAANAVLVLPARATIVPTARGLFGSFADNGLELATLCLAALNALALATLPGLALLVLPPLLIVHRAVLVKHLEVAATTDEKTGVLNTSGWYRHAERELARCQQRSATFALLMVDLDFFKQVNDTHGHLAGDQVLRAVADTIGGQIRERDAVGRFGGEEFVVLLAAVGDRDAASAAERVRAAVAELQVEVPQQADTITIHRLSASIGVATFPDDGSDLQGLLDAADTALYEAKNAGRNRVVQAAGLHRP